MPSASDSTAAPPRDRVALDSGQARLLLRALADPIRLQVIHTLAAGERCVCDLTADLGQAQSKLSFHLKVLKEAGLVADRQSGRWVYYRLRPETITALGAWLGTLTTACDQPHQGCA
jgi:ArsR family transcriptional regulator